MFLCTPPRPPEPCWKSAPIQNETKTDFSKTEQTKKMALSELAAKAGTRDFKNILKFWNFGFHGFHLFLNFSDFWIPSKKQKYFQFFEILKSGSQHSNFFLKILKSWIKVFKQNMKHFEIQNFKRILKCFGIWVLHEGPDFKNILKNILKNLKFWMLSICFYIFLNFLKFWNFKFVS